MPRKNRPIPAPPLRVATPPHDPGIGVCLAAVAVPKSNYRAKTGLGNKEEEHSEGFRFFSPSCNGASLLSRDSRRKLGKRASHPENGWRELPSFLFLESSLFLGFALFAMAPLGHPVNLEKWYVRGPRTRLPLLPSSQRPEGELLRGKGSRICPICLDFVILPHPKFSPSPSPHQHQDTEQVIFPCPVWNWRR